jgi:Ca2+-binding EF-hand superfamily protein
MKHENPNILKESFENVDEKNQGILDIANFKTCLMKAKLNITINDIQRIARYIERDNKGNIDYCVFLKKVENSFKITEES